MLCIFLRSFHIEVLLFISRNRQRGFLVFPVDPLTCTLLSDGQLFDTYANGTNPLISYITNMTVGIVYGSITLINPALHLAINKDLVRSLSDLGVFAADMGPRGSVVFVTQKGYSNATLFSKSIVNTYPSATLSALVIGELTLPLNTRALFFSL
jgi:hypothetical protein